MNSFDIFNLNKKGPFLYGFDSRSSIDKHNYRICVIINNTIRSILKEYGICSRYNGYSYIIDAVVLLIDQINYDIKLINDVYPYIKEKYNLRNTDAVEHSIRNAIKTAYIRCHNGSNDSRMKHFDKKPTNKQFLRTVTHDVIKRVSHEMASCPV